MLALKHPSIIPTSSNCPQNTQAKFEGEEVDFDESYFFPPWEKVREVEEAKRQARSA